MFGRLKDYFTKTEWIIFISSVSLIIISFGIFDRENWLTLIASLLGATSLILCAKGNPLGQVIIVIFSFIYGYISFSYAYYGEMITYLGMSAPMAVVALVEWLRNPFKGKKSEVAVNRLKRGEVAFMFMLAIVVTIAGYFLLKALGASNIIPSTISVTTSFIPAYLIFRRCPYYALGYAANDIVLIVLWIMAAVEDKSYISVVICFAMFLVNDIYSFISWRRMQRRQESVA